MTHTVPLQRYEYIPLFIIISLNYLPHYFFFLEMYLYTEPTVKNTIHQPSAVRPWFVYVPAFGLFLPTFICSSPFSINGYIIWSDVLESIELSVHSTHSQTQTSYLEGARCFTIVLINVFFFCILKFKGIKETTGIFIYSFQFGCRLMFVFCFNMKTSIIIYYLFVQLINDMR